MSNDVLITPASRKIEFKDSSGTVDAKIETDSSGNLTITNPGGDISIGDTTADVFIGDGINSVDIVFEQNGEIRGTSGVTLTLGDANTTLRTGTDLSLNSNDITNVGDISTTTVTASSTLNAQDGLFSGYVDSNGLINGFMYRVDDTTVIDSSRNLTNIGTISSGSITSSGNITAGSGSGFITAGTTSGYVYAKSLRLNNAEISDTDFQFAFQMIVDANDADSNVPNHGDCAGDLPFGVYFLGDNNATTKTLGSGLVKLWNTGHFSKTHIDHFVGLQAGTQNLTVPDLSITGDLSLSSSSNFQMDGLNVITSARNMQNIGNINIGGYYAMDGTTLIDTSKNIVNVNNITTLASLNLPSSSSSLGIYAGITQIFEGSTRNLKNLGTINSGAISSSGLIKTTNTGGFMIDSSVDMAMSYYDSVPASAWGILTTNNHADTLISTNLKINTNHDLITNQSHSNVKGSGIVFTGNGHSIGAGKIAFYANGDGTATGGDTTAEENWIAKLTDTSFEVAGNISASNTTSSATLLSLGGSSQTSYTVAEWKTSAHTGTEAYIIAYGAGHATQPGNFAIKNLEANSDIFFELASSVEPLRLTSAGAKFANNVGIGHDSFGFNSAGLPLVVGGGSGNTGMTIFSGADSVGSIHFTDSEVTSASSYIGYINYNHTSNYMRFGTNAAERVRIDSSGNVGIGATSPTEKLQVSGNIKLQTNGNQLKDYNNNNIINNTSNIINIGSAANSATEIHSSALQGESPTLRLRNMTALPGGYVESDTLNFRFDESATAYAGESHGIGGTINQTTGTTISDDNLKRLFSYTADYINLNTYKDASNNVVIELDGISVSNSANTNWKPYVFFHSGAGNVATMTVEVKNGAGTWETVENAIDCVDFYIRDGFYVTSSGILKGARFTFTNITGNAYLRMIGVIGKTHASYQWNVLKSGGKMFGDLDFGDSKKVTFGNSEDLSIYHDGSDSYIQESGTGDLRIRAQNLRLQDNDGTNFLYGVYNAQVELFHNNSKKFETTSTGIDVTGNITTSGTLYGPATFTIDPAAHDDNTGTVVIAGNLQVDGTTTTINSTTLTVDDLNITLASGSSNAAAANGAGITVDCGSDTDATLSYNSPNDRWQLNKPLHWTYSTATTALSLNNNNIVGVNNIAFSDPGGNEGLQWSNIRIFESPNDLSNASGNFQVTYGGTRRLTVDNTGIDVNGTMQVVAGDAGTSAYSITSNGGDLVLKAGADDVVLRTGGSGTEGIYFQDGAQATKMFIDAETGRVGIGTTSPDAQLDIRGGSVTDIIVRSSSTDSSARVLHQNDARVYSTKIHTNDFFQIKDETADVARLVINTSGNVGIGTTSPVSKLDVLGDGKFRGTADGTAVLKLGQRDNNASTQLVTVYTDDAGTTRPLGADSLEFFTGRYIQVIGGTRTSAAGGDVRSWKFTTTTNGDERATDLILYSQADSSATGSTTTVGNVQISATSNRTSYINTSGDFGLGTAAPTHALHIVRSSASSEILAESDTGYATLKLDAATGAGSGVRFLKGGTEKVRLQSEPTSHDLSIRMSGTLMATLTQAGYLGIGTDAPADPLHVVGDIRSTTRVLTGDGTVTKPSFQFVNSVNTGIYRPAADEIGFVNNASESVRIDSSGNVGIGTTSPARALDIIGPNGDQFRVANTTADATLKNAYHSVRHYTNSEEDFVWALAQSSGSQNTLYLGGSTSLGNAATAIRFYTAGNVTTTSGTERMRITSDGDVGIGTTSPTHNLHIQSSAAAAAIKLRRDDSAKEMLILIGSGYGYVQNTTGPLGLGGSNDDRDILIDTSGRVGVGTISPSTKLHIADSATPVFRIEHTGGTARYVDIYNSSGAMYLRARNDTANGNIVFQGGGGGTNTEYARFESSGEMGIGTTSPQARLHIHNSGTGVGDHAYAHFTTGDTGAGSTDGLTIGVSADANAAINFRESTGALKIIASNELEFFTGGSERMTIVGSGAYVGHVGIGTTTAPAMLTVKDANFPQLRLEDDDDVLSLGYSGNNFFFKRSDNDGSFLFRRTDNTDVFTIKMDTQRVGIGTAAPEGIMHFVSDTDYDIIFDNTSQERFRLRHGTSGIYFTGPDTNVLAFGIDQSHDVRVFNTSGGAYAVFDGSTSRLGIGTTSPSATFHVDGSGLFTGSGTYTTGAETRTDASLVISKGTYLYSDDGNYPRILIGHNTNNDIEIGQDSTSLIRDIILKPGTTGNIKLNASGSTDFIVGSGGNVGIGTTSPSAKLQVEELGIDTTTTSTTATTQVAIDTFAAATFRSARYTIQVTNSTDSTYHLTEILLIHDGTTPQITEYGTIFTGSAEATFDADISSGNVRLLATPATTDSMTFKVVRHCITV